MRRVGPTWERPPGGSSIESAKSQSARTHQGDVDPYWVTAQRAAEVLGVNVTRLNQLATRGFPPFETTNSGTRLYRREQLQVVAHARAAEALSLYAATLVSPERQLRPTPGSRFLGVAEIGTRRPSECGTAASRMHIRRGARVW
jgi:hypothetical protein